MCIWVWGGRRWLFKTSLSRNCVPTLHEYKKGPGTHSQKNVFFVNDTLGSPFPFPGTGSAEQGCNVPYPKKPVLWSLSQYQALSTHLLQGLDAQKTLHPFNFPSTQNLHSSGQLLMKSEAWGMCQIHR